MHIISRCAYITCRWGGVAVAAPDGAPTPSSPLPASNLGLIESLYLQTSLRGLPRLGTGAWSYSL